MIFESIELWKPTEDTNKVIIPLEKKEKEIILCIAIEYTSSFSFKVRSPGIFQGLTEEQWKDYQPTHWL